MSPLFASRALLFAGECFAASALLLALAWVASLFLRQAATRHLMWLTAFGVSLMLPLAALIVPPQIAIQHREAAADRLPVVVPRVAPGMVPATSPAMAALPAQALPATVPGFIPAAPAPRRTWPEISTQTVTRALFAAWLLGVFWALARLAAGALGLETLRRRSRPHALASQDLPRLEAGPRECELRLSDREDGPLTWGILRPVVLLPRAATAWPRERLQAVLLHELAHVRRRDSLSQLLSLVACALYWPNPLIWLGARALRREAEIAADDTVLMLGMRPSDYAGALLRVASEAHGHAVSMAGVAMASGSALEARVKSVLKPNQSRKGVTAMDVWKTASLGLALTAVLAVARPGLVEAASDPAPAATPSDAVPPDAVDPVTPEAPAEPAVPATPARHASRPHHVHQHIVRIDEDDSKDGQRVVRKITIDGHLTQQEQADIDREVSKAQAQARQAEIAIARIEPEIERAIASAKISETVARALEKAHVSEKVAQALDRARTQIEREQQRMDHDMQRGQAERERAREAAGRDRDAASRDRAAAERDRSEDAGDADEDNDDESPE